MKESIPYIVFESSLAREERFTKRLFIVIALLVVCWSLTVVIFVWYLTLPAEEFTTQTVDDVENTGEINQNIGD